VNDAPRPRVLLMHDILDPGPALLAEACEVLPYPDGQPLEQDAIRRAAEGCSGIVSQVMDPIGETVLSTPGLKVVSNVAVGFDNIDVPAATRHGVLVTNTPGVLTETTAEFAFALLMAAARRVAEGDRFLRTGRPWVWGPELLLGTEVHGKTLGVVGFGRIGRAVARRAPGFGMPVLYTGAHRLPAAEEVALGVGWRDLDGLLAEADFVSLHAALTPATRHLIGAEQLRRMKPTAVLVNTARGPLVDEAALAAALRDGQLAAAGLDVFEREPEVNPDLLGLDNVTLVPHLGSATVETRVAMGMVAAGNLLAALAGERPPNLLNPEALGARS
jgi:glyoxylate reductase